MRRNSSGALVDAYAKDRHDRWQTPSPVLQPMGMGGRAGSLSKASNSQMRSPGLYPQPEERLLLDDLHLDEPSLSLPVDVDDSDVDEDENDDSNSINDHTDCVHVEGIPRSHVRLDARRYATPSFAQAMLELLSFDLALPGWTDFPPQAEGSHLSIHKVSGATTNAVFFVSCPQIMPPPPTVLVRVYGPSSGSLVSRRAELHLLHTLSSKYGIGPQVLGTFDNGRVEEYFKSRALHKEEIRETRISRWIARRMREMHTVPAESMRLPSEPPSEPSSGNHTPLRPILSGRNSSQTSLHSDTSQSSAFSFGSTYSVGSTSTSGAFSSSARSFSAPFQGPSLTESKAPNKRRSRASSRADSASSLNRLTKGKERLGVWDNITRWTREASRILKAIEKLRPLASEFSPVKHDEAPTLSRVLASPITLLAFKDKFDLPRFEKEVKAYRQWLSKTEKEIGKSKRCMAHNDTQYGNLLIRLASDDLAKLDARDIPIERQLTRAHEMIIVVDFEYAALNARGYDIANNFVEWQSDYHNPRYSYSLGAHLTYPTLDERRVFYRAYNALDNGRDDAKPDLPPLDAEDPRIHRLEEEVRIWQPATHANWANWGVIQARDEILSKVEEWLERPAKARADNDAAAILTPTEESLPDLPPLQRTRSGELIDTATGNQVDLDFADGSEAEFDYLLYALERMAMFRKEVDALGIAVE